MSLFKNLIDFIPRNASALKKSQRKWAIFRMKHKSPPKKCKSGYFIKTHLQFTQFKLAKQYTNTDTTLSLLCSGLTLRGAMNQD